MVGFPQVALPGVGTRGRVWAAVVRRGRPGVPSVKASGAGVGAGRQSLGVTVAALRRRGGCCRASRSGGFLRVRLTVEAACLRSAIR